MYEQIMDGIRQAALNGEIPESGQLPSVRQLSADLNVSAITTKRAYMDLEREGLIYTVPGKGTFIRLNDVSKVRIDYHRKQLDEFSENVKQLLEKGISKEELIETINKL